jgi:hypothetical protein
MAASVGLVQEAAHQLLGGEHPLLGWLSVKSSGSFLKR